jgi:glutamyl-tRNA synthetase
MNGVYLRNMDMDKYYELVRPYIYEVVDEKFDHKLIANAIHDRVNILSEIKEMIGFINKTNEYDKDIYTNKKAKTDADLAKIILPEVLNTLSSIEVWNNDNIFAALAAKAQELGYKNITMMYPMQVALSGRSVAAGGATAIAEILGKEETLNRIKNAIDKLD